LAVVRRRAVARRLAVVLAMVVCGGLALGAGSAFAAFKYPFDGQLAPAGGSFGTLEVGSVAVDDGSGDTYVADSASGVVDVFATATGAQLASWNGSAAGNPPGAPAGSFGGGQVAVAANDGTGRVYVLDPVHDVVDVLDGAGGYVCQITGSTTPSASECNGVAGSATPAGGFNKPGGIAVDRATGDVYVVDANNGVVDVFSVGGAYLRQISLASIPGGFSAQYTRGIAVDDFNGDVYLSDSGTEVVYVFDAAGGYVTTWTGSNTPQGSFGGGYVSVAADDANGDVYVARTGGFTSLVDVFESSGGYLTQFGRSPGLPLGVAVDQGSGRVYLANEPSEVGEPWVVDVFGPSLVIPSVATGAAGEVRGTSATLNGTVNPDGVQLSDCRFEYGIEAYYGQSAPCVPAAASIPADSNEHAVSAHITGLTPGSTYHFRLVAANENDPLEPNTGEDATFETLPGPSFGGVASVNVTDASADLTAKVNPNGYDTTYHFEWGTSTSYGTSVPVPDVDIGAGTGGVSVATHLSGLSANTTYHWRVVATNENGTVATGDQTFVYDTTGGGLPDNRAYEMVTPPQKNGALIQGGALILKPAVAEDGSRVIFNSIQCFAGAGSCTGNRQVEGEPFEFSRTSGGWVTSALAPPATRFDQNTNWLISADTGMALFGIPTPPFGEDDWYARQPDGSFVDIGPTSPPADGPVGEYAMEFAVTTADLSHVLFQAKYRWPFDAGTQESSLYEYVGSGNAQPVLVGVSGGPGSTDLISVCGTYAGDGENVTSHFGAVSADGGTVFFTAFACASGSGANAGIPVPVETLYARIGGSRTVKISAGAAAAKFEGASTDGSRVFFSEGGSLYEYDFTNPTGHNLVAVGGGVQGVMGVSSDGSHVYFVSRGVLSAAANSQGLVAREGASNLYVFERDASYPAGRVAFIAALGESDEPEWTFEAERPNVTPDGRFLVFTSHGDLTSDDTSTTGAAQVFRYDAQTGELVRISIGERGFDDNGNAGTGDASIVNVSYFNIGVAGPARLDPTMSHDGAFVFFQSPVGLTPGALNDVPIGGGVLGVGLAQNVYEWHAGRVYLISDGRDTAQFFQNATSAVKLYGSDASGANVFFSTADQLVPQDTDTGIDVYDARICTVGEPCVTAPPPPVACQGEACRGTPEGAPSLLAPASVSFSGAGNLAPPGVKPVVRTKKKPKKPRKAKGRRRRVAGKRGKTGRAAKHIKRGRR